MMRFEDNDIVLLDDTYTQGEECFGRASSFYEYQGKADGNFTANDSRYSHLDGVFPIEAFLPVRLTAEDIKHQGYDRGIVAWEKVNGGFLLSVRGESSFTGRVNYVHELQHALRVCGFEQLADNFKIY